MLTKRKYKVEIARLVENDLMREQLLFEERQKLKEARATISLLLNARLPEVVQPKRMVRECIHPTLLKRAFAAINKRPEGA